MKTEFCIPKFFLCVELFALIAATLAKEIPQDSRTSVQNPCQEEACQPDYIWDTEKCACVSRPPCAIRCNVGYHLEYDENGRCFCALNDECPDAQIYDRNQGKCVCEYPIECGSGYYWNEEICKCNQLQKICVQI
ncbi:CLUMA_CG005216, isoform A [Clunio marinus]|uniref:CLUMA_CG005216, isoform A n=1 Tax=Clunio marinus TaxID=568069 RepID=A0A1J1HZK1_9DIPT|nr:CLUMA_CG005216, isoform A [Clunio marinus]